MLLSFYKENTLEAGCDEAGRGCLAGPVFAAAVILPFGYKNSDLNDSKQMSETKRKKLREIIEIEALSWAVAQVDNRRIDEINILNASIEAMQTAVDKLQKKPELLLIDGNRFRKHKEYEHICIVKGDSKYMSIAAASILAKTYRDEYMLTIHSKYPRYYWNENKGYPTEKHREAIQKFGITEFHRRSFRLIDNQLNIVF